ncbi:hypothetical protein [Chitinophaga pinensis]|uniref:Uncharacterized protein n=1 Tax=Chitinophaga pinensis (strain ATCC 43595 / DSM 2588 / LMG 13176 / NBRC 15968 / NCIMB 11800 / UQM 2034) TaxID=485918 RepID=A0A979GW35_CHIPD|nr:hypothetical protein [Chitinophaga pinensis]ACU61744.1 hypothetical protein Cpin_4295 [Chitinophaga pinensis DSM 2588]
MQEYIWFPALAGLMVQLLNLLEATRLDASRTPDFTSFTYWIPYIVAPILGGFAGYCTFHNSETSYTTLMAAQVGASAPLFIRSLAGIARPPQRTE